MTNMMRYIPVMVFSFVLFKPACTGAARICQSNVIYRAYVLSAEEPAMRSCELTEEGLYVIRDEFWGNPDWKIHSVQVAGQGWYRSPAWAYDGRRLAFLSFSNNFSLGRVCVVDVDDGSILDLNTGRIVPYGLSWSMSGGQLAYCTAKEDGCFSRMNAQERNICIYDVETDKETRVIEDVAEDVMISPTASNICYMTREWAVPNDIDKWRLNIVNVQTRVVVRITSADDNFGVAGVLYWGDDSRSILFVGYSLTNGYAEPGWYKYVLGSEAVERLEKEPDRVNDQSFRYWKGNRTSGGYKQWRSRYPWKR